MNAIAVLVAARTHPVSQRPTRCRADATAVALGLSLPLPLRLLAAGDMPDAVARDYLALGAPAIDILPCAEDAPLPECLAPALREVPWVLTGTRSPAERGTGWLPHALARVLGRPLVTDVWAVEPDGNAWTVIQALPKGARRRLRVHGPAVLAVAATAPFTLRHSLADATAGRITRAAAPASAPGPSPGRRVTAVQHPQPLQARTAQSGRARLLGAIDSPSSGGTVIRSGSPDAKAQAVLDYLRRHSLVSF